MTDARSVAEHFVRARRAATALPGFPGVLPETIEDAYACQKAAISLWPDTIAGWKIGRAGPPWTERFGTERLVGPMFTQSVRHAQGNEVEFPVFEGGFAAVEAEFIYRLRADAPAGKTGWTEQEAVALGAELHVGIETAGSPLASINDLGAPAVISDFGNNAGLILGPAVPESSRQQLDSIVSETFIDGAAVGRGGAGSLPGGPLAAFAFALGQCAQLGFPLKAGCLVSTGATTGIHSIRSGQRARVVFSGVAELHCRAVPAKLAR